MAAVRLWLKGATTECFPMQVKKHNANHSGMTAKMVLYPIGIILHSQPQQSALKSKKFYNVRIPSSCFICHWLVGAFAAFRPSRTTVCQHPDRFLSAQTGRHA